MHVRSSSNDDLLTRTLHEGLLAAANIVGLSGTSFSAKAQSNRPLVNPQPEMSAEFLKNVWPAKDNICTRKRTHTIQRFAAKCWRSNCRFGV